MFKKIFAILFLIIFLPLSVQAHTTLKSSTPAEGDNITRALEKIELVFGTKIEEGSSMTLEGAGQTFELDRIAVKEDLMTAELSEPLQSGSYRIVWTIIGEDGHPIEGEVAFAVSIEAEEKAATSPEAAEEPVEQSVAASEQQAGPAVATEDDGNVLVTILLGLAAVLAVFGIYKVLMKKK